MVILLPALGLLAGFFLSLRMHSAGHKDRKKSVYDCPETYILMVIFGLLGIVLWVLGGSSFFNLWLIF